MLIGVYKDIHPFNHMAERRINALVNEAEKQNVQLVFFGIHDVNFTTETIAGDVYEGGKWIKRETPFPVLLINDTPTTENFMLDSEKEMRLRSLIPCTTHLIQGKMIIYEKMLRDERYAKYVIPSQKLDSMEAIISALHHVGKVIIKPIDGRGGNEIYFVSKIDKGLFLFQEHKKKVYFNLKQFTQKINAFIKRGNFIIQPYVRCRTNEGRPFDFRAHVLRNNKAQWIMVRLLARTGDANTYLSNVSLGGKSEQGLPFLKANYGDEKGEYIFNMLEKTAIDLAKVIDSFYPYTLDELGIDLSIDDQGRIWMYEANTSPQVITFDEDRAVHVIGYAKYLGELIEQNEIMRTNTFKLIAQD